MNDKQPSRETLEQMYSVALALIHEQQERIAVLTAERDEARARFIEVVNRHDET
jgi:hypothetical protein